jgi:hypothetical protein
MLVVQPKPTKDKTWLTNRKVLAKLLSLFEQLLNNCQSFYCENVESYSYQNFKKQLLLRTIRRIVFERRLRKSRVGMLPGEL